MSRSSAPQLDLFAGPACSAPAPVFSAYTTEVVYPKGRPVVRVRLRLSGAVFEEPLPTGPLTFGECAEWDEPCKLPCRYRLEDAVEERTRRAVDEDAPDGGDLDDYAGPRLKTGAYYSDQELVPGDWCALRVAERGGLALDELGDLFGMTKEGVNKILVGPALASAERADIDLDDAFLDYEPEGEEKVRKPKPLDDNLTSTEARRAMVPGEVPKGRSVPTIRRRKRDGWKNVTHIVVPEKFAAQVDERLMRPLAPSSEIPERFRKPLTPPGRKAA